MAFPHTLEDTWFQKRLKELCSAQSKARSLMLCFTLTKTWMQIHRGNKETFKLYVNHFEAAASELRNLAEQETHVEVKHRLAFQLLQRSNDHGT